MAGKLAINGGEPSVSFSNVTFPVYGEKEKELVLKVLESGRWWRGGSLEEQRDSVSGEFEAEFAKFNGVNHVLAVPNGTVALELALKAAGLGPGDEVIVPSISFVVTGTAPLLVNAVPVFADIDPETYQMDPADIERKITEKTRAICLVHYGGYPADMDRIMQIARKYELKVIEDCAHAHGTEWRNKKVGSIGDAGTFSFQMSKAITSGEGGAITTNDEDLFYTSYSYHHIGRLEHKGFYDFYLPAWNYRIAEFQGALLLCQLERYKEQLEVKHDNGEYLAKELGKVEGIKPLKRDERITKRGYYFFVLRYDKSHFNRIEKGKFIEALQAEGVPCWGAYGKPIYQYPLFQEMNFGDKQCPVACPHYGQTIDYTATKCPNAEHACENEQVVLKHHALLGAREDMDGIVDAILKIQKHSKELK